VFLLQEAKPFIVEIIRPPTEELSVVDVLVGALSLAGVFALAAVPLGLVAGYFLIQWNRRRRPESSHMPHISPSLQGPQERNDPTPPGSDPIR
jgi:ABC-type phosphate transport system permease subunit